MANTGKKKVRHVKGLGSIYFDASTKQWVGQVENGKYSNGRTKYKRFYSKSQDEIVYKMKEFKKTNVVILNDNDETTKLRITVSDYFLQYLTNVKKNKLKPSSYDRDIRTCTQNVIPYIGGYFLSELTANIIQHDLITSLMNNGYSYSTIHKAYVFTNEALNYAFKNNVIQSNPCSLVDKPSKKVFTNTKEIRFFSDDEIERFVNIALSKNKNNQPCYQHGYHLVILLYTGLRAGEIMTLKWSDVDFDNLIIKVHSNVVMLQNSGDKNRTAVIQDTTKTKKSRIVPMTQSAQKYLHKLYELQNPKSGDYVVRVNGVRYYDSLSTTYRIICQKANIDNHQRLHTLRHTCASLLIRKGVDIKIISEMLGHSSVSFTYDTYVHLIEEEKIKSISQLDV